LHHKNTPSDIHCGMTFHPLTDSTLEDLLGFLQDEQYFVFLETTRISAENRFSMLFLQPVASLQCRAGQPPADFFVRAEQYLTEGYYLAGWCAYELGYLLEPVLARGYRLPDQMLLADLGVFRQPHIFDHGTGAFAGAGPWPQAGVRPVSGYELRHLRLNQRKEKYLAAIGRIKHYIEAGDTYQVNYTLKLLFDFVGSPEDFYRTLRRGQSVSYGAYLRNGRQRLLSFSPELFFRKSGASCTVRPMKGTIRRGCTEEEDAALAAFLCSDEKNRSENVMIVDLLRNDLGRLCRMGSVAAAPLFEVESFESLHQMTSTIHGELRPEVSLAELFGALFPCGSVTGAPKIRTMEIIRELELTARGMYTGGIGYLGPAGEAVFNVPIRTVVLDGEQGEMGIGSGIVADSEPETEWEECLLKSRFMTHPQPEFELIETMVWLPEEGYWLLPHHLERLLASACRLGFAADRRGIEQYLRDLRGRFPDSPQRVRLTLAKDGRLAGSFVCCSPPAREIFPAATGGLPLVLFSASRVDSGDRLLYHKTTRRELFDREREKAVAAGYYEVLFCNERGEVTEGSITNVFARRGARLVTPPVSCGLLDGVCRRHLLAANSLPVEEQVLSPADLQQADAIYVANSVRGLVQVEIKE
jgi:para-aminobenzoate synthetase / 4-amino-4-deoxychorismate lyase